MMLVGTYYSYERLAAGIIEPFLFRGRGMRIEQIEIEVMETDIILSQDDPIGDVPISISFPLVQWELVKTLIEDGIKDIGDKHGKN